MRYRARQWAHSESHSPLRPDKEEGHGAIRIVLEKDMLTGQKSYFGFFKIAWWSAIFFS